jgi:hypothetical protein
MYMDAERMMMQRRIDNLMEQLDMVKRQRDALLKTIDVEYIARLEEKAIKLDMLEETLKRGFRMVNGGAEDA